ncbi:MAG TPA: YdcF family protein [Vicinamibacterales bacterium]|nr:YdcF family protein [Vicinamibacterales bacterium]
MTSGVVVPPQLARRKAPDGRWLFRRRNAGALVLLIAIGLIGGYAARETIARRAAWVLTVDTVRPGADYIVPLGGGAHNRPFVAAHLYRQRIAPTVIIFEHQKIHATGEAPGLSETDRYSRILATEGVPADAIRRIPGDVADTWDEAQSLRRVLPRDGRSVIVLVTSPEHTRRASWVFSRTLTGLPVEVRVAPARHPRFDENNWWRDDEGMRLYLLEYLKLPYYWVRSALTS